MWKLFIYYKLLNKLGSFYNNYGWSNHIKGYKFQASHFLNEETSLERGSNMLKVTLEINTKVESNMTPNSPSPQPRSLSIGTKGCVIK